MGFGTLTALLALFCVAIISELKTVERRVRLQAEVATPRNDVAHEMEVDVAQLALNLQRYAFGRSVDLRRHALQSIDECDNDVSDYRRLASNDRQRELVDRFEQQWIEYRALARKVLEPPSPRLGADEVQRMGVLRESMEKLLDESLQPDAMAAFNDEIATTHLDVKRIGAIAVVLLIGGVLVAVLTSWIVGRGILRHERHIAELNGVLRHRVEELQTLMHSLPVGVLVANDPGCREISMNKAGADLLGVDSDRNASLSGPEADSLPFRVLKDGVEVLPDDMPMQRSARTASSVLGEELDVVHADGRRTSLFEHATPLFDEKGAVRGCLGVLVDVTERKRAEQALKDADRRKDEFLATLAHELRNPLAPLRNGVQLIKLAERRDPAVARQALSMMERQLAHMVRLIDDLLDVSRISRGKLELQRESMDLSAALQAAVETNRSHVDSSGRRVELTTPARPLTVQGDHVRLVQVFTNLIHNAVKYSKPGGVVSVDATAAPDGGMAVVSVKDEGVGIPADMLERVFEMFAQVDRGLERSLGGLGIGLTLVKNIVELHGGRVLARSDGVGFGSEFVVDLPIESTPAASRTPVEECGSSGESVKRKILVADDNLDAAESLAEILACMGNEVRTANDGMAALEEAEAFRPDVVLMDIGMPRLNGYDACRRLRQFPWAREISVIAITGWGQEEDRRLSREAGFDVHLVKPVAARAISKVIDDLAGAPAGAAR
jgi:signal transduction histidine kinase